MSRYEYDRYDPLAKVRNWTTADDKSRQQIHYFHCDQIGTDPHAFKADYVGKKQSDNKSYWYIAGLSVVAVVAIVSPLDGPLGDVAAIGALSGALSQ